MKKIRMKAHAIHPGSSTYVSGLILLENILLSTNIPPSSIRDMPGSPSSIEDAALLKLSVNKICSLKLGPIIKEPKFSISKQVLGCWSSQHWHWQYHKTSLNQFTNKRRPSAIDEITQLLHKATWMYFHYFLSFTAMHLYLNFFFIYDKTCLLWRLQRLKLYKQYTTQNINQSFNTR